MLKALVFVVSGVIGFMVAFSFSARDEIGEQVAERLDRDFVEYCVANLQLPSELQSDARGICSCMKGEYDRKGIAITDAFGSRNAEMRAVVEDCASMYAGSNW